jgi:flavorubredoxin
MYFVAIVIIITEVKLMAWHDTEQISQNIHWVGIRDWNRRLFDSLIPMPKGTTYNSYLVIGSSKSAVIDTVNPGFENEWDAKMSKLVDPTNLDFVVMNHAEPDHAGSIPYIMTKNSKARLITSVKGAKMAEVFYKVPQERIKSVVDGESIDLGGKTLKFIEAPMLHWPETMFTYVPENKVLFPCDFFGSHLAQALYDDEVSDLVAWAQKYFGEIMMPFRYNGQKAMEKIKDMPIEMIGPSHGPIHRNPERILNAYRKWVNGQTEKKAAIVYASMWRSTEKMVQVMADTLASEGIEVAEHNLALTDISDLAKDLVDSRAIVLGAPTVLGGAHPLGVYAAYLARVLKPPAKFAAVLSSYGWGGGAVKHLQETLGPTKMEILGAIDINGPPSEADLARVAELGKSLAKRIKEGD